MNPLSLMGLGDPSDPNSQSIGDWLKGFGVTPKSATLAGLQGMTSYGAGLAQIGQIRRNAGQSELADQLAAGDAGVNATAATVQGFGQTAGLRERLAQTLSQRAALASASGIDAGQGTVADQRRAITDEADTATNVTSLNAQMLASRFRQQQQQDLFKAMQTQQNANADVSATRNADWLSILSNAGKILLPMVGA
jgi:hypothetical protein